MAGLSVELTVLSDVVPAVAGSLVVPSVLVCLLYTSDAADE